MASSLSSSVQNQTHWIFGSRGNLEHLYIQLSSAPAKSARAGRANSRSASAIEPASNPKECVLLETPRNTGEPMITNTIKIFSLSAAFALATCLAVAQDQPAQNQSGQAPSSPQTQQTPQPQPPSAQGQTRMSSEQLQSAFQRTLQHYPELSNVNVSVTDSKLEFSGTVNSQADKDKIRRTAEANAGGRQVVVDKLNVVSSGQSTGQPTGQATGQSGNSSSQQNPPMSEQPPRSSQPPMSEKPPVPPPSPIPPR
jgi:hypothetical protein